MKGLVTAAKIIGLAKFVKPLQSRRSATYAHADHPITTASREGSDVSIAERWRRAKGHGTDYLKLKIYGCPVAYPRVCHEIGFAKPDSYSMNHEEPEDFHTPENLQKMQLT